MRKRVLAQVQAPVEHRLELRRILRVRPGHREDVLAVLHRVVGGAGLRVAAVAACRFRPGGIGVVGELDLGKLGRSLAQSAKHRILDGKLLPHEVLGDRHAAGAVGRAIGQRVPVALEKVPQVVGGALARAASPSRWWSLRRRRRRPRIPLDPRYASNPTRCVPGPAPSCLPGGAPRRCRAARPRRSPSRTGSRARSLRSPPGGGARRRRARRARSSRIRARAGCRAGPLQPAECGRGTRRPP